MKNINYNVLINENSLQKGDTMKIVKKLFVSAVLFAAFTSYSFADSASDYATAYKADSDAYIAVFNSGLTDFSENLALAVPQAAVQQNVYADAFIGKLFPAVPPHFAFGINAGATHLNTEGLAKAADKLGISGVKNSYFFPVLNADIRVGGAILPFDVGLSFMTLDINNISFSDVDVGVEFFTIAADVRYALIEDGLVTPGLSLGLGYSYNKGAFSVSQDNAEASVDYDVQTLYGQIQVSKAFNIPVARIGFTPFLGFRGIVSKYSNDWSWKFKGDYLTAIGTTVPTSGKGTVSSDNFGGFQPQIYGGLGFNFVFMQLTASACADLRHLGGDTSIWSGALSLRFKM